MCHRIGNPPISTIGFGSRTVSSPRRVPSPPARTTVFTDGESTRTGMPVRSRRNPTWSFSRAVSESRALRGRSDRRLESPALICPLEELLPVRRILTRLKSLALRRPRLLLLILGAMHRKVETGVSRDGAFLYFRSGEREIRINTRHAAYSADVLREFDYYFSSVVPELPRRRRRCRGFFAAETP